MQTVERATTSEALDDNEAGKLRKRIRRLGWLSGLLAVAVIGLIAWTILGGDDTETVSLTAEQEQMLVTIDAYLDAYNTGDATAVETVMAPTGYYNNLLERHYVAEGDLGRFVTAIHSLGIGFTRTDATFIGTLVVAHQHQNGSTLESPSIYRMSPDGTQIMWHIAL